MWFSDSPTVEAASRDTVPRLARLPFPEDSRNKPAPGSSSEELSSKEPRMKLVISCLLMCSCFSSSLEKGLARWPWGLAGDGRPLVSRVFRPSVPIPLAWSAAGVLSEVWGFPGGFWCGGGLEVLGRQASLGPLWEAGLAWLGVSGRGLQSLFFCGGSPELSDAGKGSWLGIQLPSDLLLVTGIESVIFPQIFNQEKVKQEKIKQDRKRSNIIQKACKEKGKDISESTKLSYFHLPGARGARSSWGSVHSAERVRGQRQ